MNKKEIKLRNNLSELDTLKDFLDGISAEWQLPVKTTFELNLILEEIVVNIISYGYNDKHSHEIIIIFENEAANKMLTFTVIDDGIEFNPLKKAPVDITMPVEERQIGGLGIQLMNNLTQSVTYTRNSNKNILKMTKTF
ncbi:MAG: ATP-binding protein [Candidatus Wallbacteria bacterium]